MNENEQETRGSRSLEGEGVGSTQDWLCEETLPPSEQEGREDWTQLQIGLQPWSGNPGSSQRMAFNFSEEEEERSSLERERNEGKVSFEASETGMK